MQGLPKRIHLMEVGPRDGLQIERTVLEPALKAEMIDRLTAAGISEIECGSFVNPKAVPQMATTSEVLDLITRRSGVKYRVLWLNLRGLEQAAMDKRIDVIGRVSLTASETFMMRNTKRRIEDALADIPEWMARYDAHGIATTQLSIMAAFGCNFEGRIGDDKLLALAARGVEIMTAHGGRLETLLLADTMGWANPAQIERIVGSIRSRWPDVRLRLHLHDTRGAAVANAVAAARLGVAEFETAAGGLGGCPFAGHKGAAGNVATEDLAFVFAEMGIETGIDLDALLETALWVEEVLGHPLPGKVMKGGSLSHFPA
jgi:hydroxymethylglutaryl-CoA lyase